MPAPHVCGAAPRSLAPGLSVCDACARLITVSPDGAEEVPVPRGWHLSSRTRVPSGSAAYRSAAAARPEVTLRRRSWWRHGMSVAFLGIWGVLATTLGSMAWAAWGYPSASGPLTVIAIIAVCLGPYVAATQLFDPTALTFVGSEIHRAKGFFGSRAVWSIGPRDRVQLRSIGPREVRNVPQSLARAVVLTPASSGPELVLFDDLTAPHAEDVARVVRVVLAHVAR